MITVLPRYLLKHFLGAALLALSFFAHAQAPSAAWPSGTIRLVVPFAPGGNTDIVGRLLADGLGKKLGVPVVVENRAGATGIIGANYVIGEPPDGYTFLLSTISITISPHIFSNVPADLVSRLAPVSQVTAVPKVLVVNPKLPVNSVAELVAYAKKQQTPLTYGSSGIGSAHHLSGELFRTQQGIELTHVPYKGGAPALNDLMGGMIHMVFDDVPPSYSFLQSGRLKALAVSSEQRSPLLPDVPTIAEAGYPGSMVEPWYGVLAPAATPREIVAAMDKAIGEVVRGGEFHDKVVQMGGIPQYKDTAEFTRFIASEDRKWGKVVQDAGIPRQ